MFNFKFFIIFISNSYISPFHNFHIKIEKFYFLKLILGIYFSIIFTLNFIHINFLIIMCNIKYILVIFFHHDLLIKPY